MHERGLWGKQPFSQVTLHSERLDAPLHRRKPARIGVAFMGDIFHDSVPTGFIEDVFAVMALAPQHTFLLLTKRPKRAHRFLAELCYPSRRQRVRDRMQYPDWLPRGKLFPRDSAAWPLPNVWLGVSVEDQMTFQQRWGILRKVPAAKRLISFEPLLGPIDTQSEFWEDLGEFVWPDWCIVGGESGSSARPLHPDWVRSVRDQCQAAGVPFYFKQWGEWLPSLDIPSSHADTYCSKRRGSKHESEVVGDELMIRVGKKAAGRLLDGREWLEMPCSERMGETVR